MHCIKYWALLALLGLICFSLPACASSETQAPPAAESSRATPSPQSAQPGEPITEVAQTDTDSSDEEDPDQDVDQDEEDSNQNLDKDEDESDRDSDRGGGISETNAEPEYFHGYRCTVDCSGHEAGYKWAEDHDIDDVDNCGGNSQSFIEGCQAWVEENH